jgi:hypothetical protein
MHALHHRTLFPSRQSAACHLDCYFKQTIEVRYPYYILHLRLLTIVYP